MEEKFIRDALMLWATIDPVGTLSLFAALTAGFSAKHRRRMAVKATLYALIILLGALVIGQVLLAAMGIELISLQVAGGVVLFLFGLQMIFGNAVQSASAEEEPKHDLAVFPLAIPSIASPAAIMAVIVLTDNNLYPIAVQAGTAAIMAAVIAVTFLLMLAAGPILKVIGFNGAAILIRVMGLILVALSVQLVFEAVGIERWAARIP